MGKTSNEYMRVYMLAHYHERRNRAIEKLGGRCVHCGSTEDLQLDHIDCTTRELDLGKKDWNVNEELYQKEISKCQLLCPRCHFNKTTLERGLKIAAGSHGTLSSYRYCRCADCRAAKAAYMKSYKKRR